MSSPIILNKKRGRTYPKIVLFLMVLLIGSGTITPLQGQNSDFLSLKERYVSLEMESGLILDQPAYSVGFGMGFVRNESYKVGLSLHFLLNDPTHKLRVGSEELTKLSLLGFNTAYRNKITNQVGYLASLSLNIGTSTYNRITNTDFKTSSGFTVAGKPKLGLFWQINRKTKIYISAKYLYGYIFKGSRSFQGLPLLSLGINITEIGF